jgi:hypothetical protein
MKAGNKTQRHIVDIDKTLPKITDAQKEWAYDKCLSHMATRSTKGKITCLDCGEHWQSPFTSQGWQDAVTGDNCPNCGVKVKVVTTRKKRFENESHFQVIDTHKKHQVIRSYQIKAMYFSGLPCVKDPFDEEGCSCFPKSYRYISEVSRVYITPEGKREVIGHTYQGSYYGARWTQSFCLKSKHSARMHDLNLEHVYPKRKFIKEVRRNGVKYSLQDISAFKLLPAILSNTFSETLFKVGQFKLLDYSLEGKYASNKMELYWKSLKICFRNKFIITDASSYFDYLAFLEKFNRDIHNAKFVCPEDFHKEHNRYVEKDRRLRMRIELEEQKKQIAIDEKVYAKDKKKFIGLEFGNKTVQIKFINTVEEFMFVGDVLKHCIYQSNYYNRKGSLCFIAEVNGSIKESIEFNLKNMSIVQSRGRGNNKTPFHDVIVSEFKKNIPKIKKAFAPKKRKRKTQKQVA